MFDNKEVAARQLPIAHGPTASNAAPGSVGDGREVRTERRRPRRLSESRLRATVVVVRKRDDGDPYADVPCTD